ncbi:hypothetical protein GCM10023063_18700 [Arthrobacter methylotrophus]|uniref:Uncharacterized protein n=1 Tax=Arthrobacter methylotrophus TaxID=121291 RepID=A0ABV5UR07_9MICC
MTTTSRQPRGVRIGGQFAPTAHAEPSLTSLAPVDTRPNVGNAPLNKRELMGPGTLNDRNPAWTPTAIKKFLGEPDKLVRNPVYRNAPQMRMFLTERVEEIEATDEWKTWEDGYLRRSAANGRKKPEEEKTAPKVELGHGRNGFYPVLRR